MKSLLTLQGGGCLGKGQAAALSVFEAHARVPLHKIFALVGGTSVGCINGGMVAAGIPTHRINQFFDVDAPKIFRNTLWSKLTPVTRLFRSAKYDPAPLEAALRELLGHKTLRDCKTRFVATAVDMASGRNVYFQSYGQSHADEDEVIIGPDSDIELWQVMRASSAAQSYFPGFRWRDFVFWDGGSTGCNAPDMLVYTEARQLFAETQLKMMSLGAGRAPWRFNGGEMVNPGIGKILDATLEIAYACGEANEVWQAKAFLGDRHFRMNPKLPVRFAIDDPSLPTLNALKDAWLRATHEQRGWKWFIPNGVDSGR